MNIFDELEDQYNDIDQLYAKKEFEAIENGRTKEERKYTQKRNLNDQAYFLFMFSRLEDHINNECDKLIAKKKRTGNSWRQNVAWSILPTKSKDMNFQNRLALLVEKGKSDYETVSKYYKERNSIAHGGNFISPIIMPTVITELKKLYKILRA